MASQDVTESMDEDFTGFDEEPVVVNTGGTAVLLDSRVEDAPADTDSDSGNLVIAEPHKKVELKNSEKSPRKRKSRVEDVTPTRTPSSRVRGQGLAFLLAMEKGGSKKQLAKAQAQSDSHDAAPSSSQPADPPAQVPPEVTAETELEKKKIGKDAKENAKNIKDKDPTKILKEKEAPSTVVPATASPTPIVKTTKNPARKSYSAINISSPLLKEPFKEGWRREVVYRATVDPGTKTLCDVYYYTPDGKKLRSGREVSDYLDKTDTNFSVENFTFFKEPIGMDSSQEILRYAKTRRDDGGGGEKLISKKEKALKAREEELRRNLQELGEDVAAITGHTPAKEAEVPAPVVAANTTTAVPVPAPESVSPQQRKKRGGKVEKQLKIKLWGKGLRSKENAEPTRKEDTTEGEDDMGAAVALSGKVSPSRKLPDDISHLFTPHSVVGSKGVTRSTTRGQKATPSSAAGNVAVSAGAGQQLELINGKRFISIGSSPESVRHSPANHLTEDVYGKRGLSSPGQAPKQSPKRMKLGMTPMQSTAVQYPFKSKEEGFGFFLTEHFNNFVSYAYHGLLHVFRYLTVQELMAAAGVCKLWRDLALHHSHWRLVRLKNSRIYDWSLFANHLRRAGTQHLDMRKMLFVTSTEETWTNLERAASNLSEILRIDLCKCPTEVLESIAKYCLRLKHIDAQFISSPTLRLELLGNLSHLEVLKIRSISRIILDEGLQSFSKLKELKFLNLTTVSNLKSSALCHLTELPHLESLEIGDCAEWTEASDYEMLGQLSRVKHLRLEQGPPTSVLQHLEHSLNGMSSLQHLELISFTIDAPLTDLRLSNIKRLLVIPCYTTETVAVVLRHLFDCLVSLSHLQQLSWVVTDEILANFADSKLPIKSKEKQEEEEKDGTEGKESVTLDELQDLLHLRLSNTNVQLIRLPEYATHRHSLSVSQED